MIYTRGERGSLEQLLCDDKRVKNELFWKVRLKIVVGLAKALNYLHRHDPNRPAYHRDVKSANVVLDDVWNPLLIDCGLSWLLHDERAEKAKKGQAITLQTYDFVGTPGYLCPTYANSNKYSTASEIYAFGILLIEIITGKVQSKENEEGHRVVDVFCKYANGYSGVNALLPMPQVKEKATEWLMNNKDSRIPVDLNILKDISVVAINCLNIEPEKRQNMSGILRRLQLLYNNCWNEHEKALENEIQKLRQDLL